MAANKKYGFLSAGQSWTKWGRKLAVLSEGDIVVAYLKKYGYVGIGLVAEKSIPAVNFKFKGDLLSRLSLKEPRILEVKNELKDAEFLVKINWIRTFTRENAKWERGLFSTALVVASLENQTKTLSFLERKFEINFDELLTSTCPQDSVRRTA